MVTYAQAEETGSTLKPKPPPDGPNDCAHPGSFRSPSRNQDLSAWSRGGSRRRSSPPHPRIVWAIHFQGPPGTRWVDPLRDSKVDAIASKACSGLRLAATVGDVTQEVQRRPAGFQPPLEDHQLGAVRPPASLLPRPRRWVQSGPAEPRSNGLMSASASVEEREFQQEKGAAIPHVLHRLFQPSSHDPPPSRRHRQDRPIRARTPAQWSAPR